MVRFDREVQLYAMAVAALAGYVDAVGFVASSGYFVSFMSGNSTRFGVDAAGGLPDTARPFLLIATFVLGVVIASLVRRRLAPPDRPAATVGGSALCLTLAAAGSVLLPPFATCLIVALAMGWINLLFEEEGDVRIGLTYMTGTLVKMGHRLADAIAGGPRWDWAPFLGLWLGLVTGALTGARMFGLLGFAALWLAVSYGWILMLVALLARRELRGR